jgi:hypothetical protein
VGDSLGPLAIHFGKWNVEMSTEVRKSFAKEDKEYTSVYKHRCAGHLLPPKPGRVSRVQVIVLALYCTSCCTAHGIQESIASMSLLILMISWFESPVE